MEQNPVVAPPWRLLDGRGIHRECLLRSIAREVDASTCHPRHRRANFDVLFTGTSSRISLEWSGAVVLSCGFGPRSRDDPQLSIELSRC